MKKMPGIAAIVSMTVLLLASVRAGAQDSMSLGEPTVIPSITQQWGKWEAQLYWGQIIPVKKNTFSHDVNNVRAYDLLAGESAAEETAEGWVAPPLPGNSTISGTLKNFSEVGFQVYRQIAPAVAVGADFGYGLKRSIYVDNPGVYVPSDEMTAAMSANIYHINAPVRFGDWIGNFRPHLTFGPGMYFVQETVTLAFTDPDDPQAVPVNIIDNTSEFFGVVAGGGIDLRIGEIGRAGIDLEYHKIFSPLGRLDFVVPRFNLSAAF